MCISYPIIEFHVMIPHCGACRIRCMCADYFSGCVLLYFLHRGCMSTLGGDALHKARLETMPCVFHCFHHPFLKQPHMKQTKESCSRYNGSVPPHVCVFAQPDKRWTRTYGTNDHIVPPRAIYNRIDCVRWTKQSA